MNIRAIAFDMDDTLLRDDRTISPYTLEVLRRAASEGVHIIPASGRARDSLRPFVEEIGCASLFIACNGAEVWTPELSLLRSFSFPDSTAQEIVAFARAHRCYAQTYDSTHFYYLLENQYARDYAASSMIKGFYTPDMEGFIRAHPTSKILLMDDPARVAAMLAEASAQFAGHASVTCSKPFFLEFNPPEATKGNALAACGERLGFSLADCAAFGDSLNDLSMLTAVGFGCVVANCRPDVRARVAHVCGDNMSDGVARMIASLLWKEERL